MKLVEVADPITSVRDNVYMHVTPLVYALPLVEVLSAVGVRESMDTTSLHEKTACFG